MNANIKQNNHRDFIATCSEAEILKTEQTKYKFVSMFGEKTLIYWKKSGRIPQRIGHKTPKN